uniref:Uncharacterized protein n=1 Tax=Setaria viridis TaxID=4556 RepID=A0A4U6U5H9_SETVI|nr:hypothetical protein SEVIR_6G094300v2 [Setaria viridis]
MVEMPFTPLSSPFPTQKHQQTNPTPGDVNLSWIFVSHAHPSCPSSFRHHTSLTPSTLCLKRCPVAPAWPISGEPPRRTIQRSCPKLVPMTRAGAGYQNHSIFHLLSRSRIPSHFTNGSLSTHGLGSTIGAQLRHRLVSATVAAAAKKRWPHVI